MFKLIRLGTALLFASACSAQSYDLISLGAATFTRPSIGVQVKNNGSAVMQASKASESIGGGFSVWRGRYGLCTLYEWSPTDSKLSTVSNRTLTIWGIDRHEVAFLAMERFFIGHHFAPYAGAGPMGTVLWGGDSGPSFSGFDGQLGLALSGGTDVWLTRRMAIRLGLQADFLKASTFSDQTYIASQTQMLEPQAGLVWHFFKGE